MNKKGILTNRSNNVKRLTKKQRDILIRKAKADKLHPSIEELIEAFDIPTTKQNIYWAAAREDLK